MPKNLTIEGMRNIAAKKGGVLLSEKFINGMTKLLWQCREGHKWEARPYSIERGTWCPACSYKIRANNLRRTTIEDMKDIAAKRGGECLSEKYINTDTKLHWRCKDRHEWWAIPKHIKKGVVWCPRCAGKARANKTRGTIEEMQAIAIEREGRCLSEHYVDNSSELFWQCKNRHKWLATPSAIKQGRWCGRCAGYAPLLEDIQAIAGSRGGKCLSEKYINSSTKLRWQCREGHQWNAMLNAIRNGQWCPYCAKKVPLTIEEMQELAAERGGRCLSNKYVNSQTKLRWECGKGHVFEATPSHVKTSKSWCRFCGYKTVADKLKFTMEEIRGLAAKRGGECLSEKYDTGGDKILWRCKEGHEWEAKPAEIIGGSWCPSCTEFVNEALIRAMFEKIFNAKFIKCRPKWLVGSKGYVLELDGYNKNLEIAFEYHGEQHYRREHYFFKSKPNIKTTFDKRITDDAIKRKLCKENGVKLIEIPFSVRQRDFFDYIAEQCKKGGIKISLGKRIDYLSLSIFSKTKLQELKDVAAARGGDCISTAYLGNAIKLTWRCGSGHAWEAAPVTVITSGHWCPFCSGRAPLTLEEMKNIATERGGQCLSTAYKNVETKLRWRCKEGHEWETTPHGIRAGYWCPRCAAKARGNKRRLTIGEMEDIAIGRGGRCLSEKYINNKTKLQWECRLKHRWEAKPDSIKNGTWCAKCNREFGWGHKKIIPHPLQPVLF